jgi:hypothetical protein
MQHISFAVKLLGRTLRKAPQIVNKRDVKHLIAVLNGVGPGERVVTSGATTIRNGDQVRVILD